MTTSQQPQQGSSQALEDEEVAFINTHFSDARRLHLFVIAASTTVSPNSSAAAGGSALLLADTQQYLKQLYQKYASTPPLRRRLVSGKCLHFLQCLTDAHSREAFIAAAASASFVSAAL